MIDGWKKGEKKQRDIEIRDLIQIHGLTIVMIGDKKDNRV